MGNALVILVFTLSGTLRRKNIINVYIVNQSCIDLLCSLVLVSSAGVDSSGLWDATHGDIYCKVWLTKLPLWSCMVSSTYNLIMLTIERYLQLVHPLWHKVYFSTRNAALSMAFAWVIGPLYNSSYMIPTSAVINGHCSLFSQWTSATCKLAVGILTVLLQFIIPLCFFIYAYTAIAVTLHRKSKIQPSLGAAVSDNVWQEGRDNTIKTLIIVCVCFVLCWSTNQIYYLMHHSGCEIDFTSFFYHCTVFAVYTNCCINPIIYAIKFKPFQEAAKALVYRSGRIHPLKSARLNAHRESMQSDDLGADNAGFVDLCDITVSPNNE